MQIACDLAGYDYSRSDELRWVMKKGSEQEIQKQREFFVNGVQGEDVPGCVANGIPEHTAKKLFDDMKKVSKCLMNKSHATAYAMIAYRAAFLKTHYPVEFMAAAMTPYISENDERIAKYTRNCKEMGIEVLPPCPTRSERKCSVEDGKIRTGWGDVSNEDRAAEVSQ